MFEKLTSLSFLQLIRHKSVQNFIFLLFIQSSNILISLMVMPLLIQSIGVDQFGLVSLALSVILIANVFVGFGYNLSGPKDVALNQDNKRELSAIISRILSSKILLAVMATGCLLVAIFGFDFFPEYKIILIYSLLMLFSEATLPVWFFQGMEKMRLVSVANVFSKLLYLTGIVFFIQGPADAKWVNFCFGGAALTVNLLVLVYVHFIFQIRIYFAGFGKALQSCRRNIYLFLSNIASHISVSGGMVILSFFASANILGMYSLAERVSMVLRMFPSLTIAAIYPNASKLYEQDKVVFYRFLLKVYRMVILGAVIITAIILVLAPFIIQLLAKELILDSVVFLRILAFVPLMATLNIANMIMILVTDQKKLLFNSSWIFCLYMLLIAIIMTAWLGGKGLAYALVSTEIVIFITCSLLIKKHTPVLFSEFYGRLFGSHHHS
ncbi:oligosaccharide flippase family protein [Echinicola sp. CAU 1574]|uniref:Oligosaccharide flippase family protein n=1 Tax=Echinicola arenosa TaxID=2774144 RepID=A0ABR9AIN9_9BACT|nr:oligosaccharide flippase family protein [Echinicola arenosa]MBD8488663.1 oligosaccharide flippase family protein [Echinicola arenosa]